MGQLPKFSTKNEDLSDNKTEWHYWTSELDKYIPIGADWDFKCTNEFIVLATGNYSISIQAATVVVQVLHPEATTYEVDIPICVAAAIVFGLMLAAVNRNAELAAPVAKVLHEMAADKDVPDADAEACMLRFHDDLGNGGDVHGPLTEFLSQHGEAI